MRKIKKKSTQQLLSSLTHEVLHSSAHHILYLIKDEIILKRFEPYTLSNESFVVSRLNKLRLPTFQKGLALVHDKESQTDSILFEYIGRTTLRSYLKNVTSFPLFSSIILQLYLSLRIAHEKIGFTHYNLILDTIYIMSTQQKTITYTLSSGKKICVSTYGIIPVMSRFENAYCDGLNELPFASPLNNVEKGMLCVKPNICFDYYSLMINITSGILNISETKNDNDGIGNILDLDEFSEDEEEDVLSFGSLKGESEIIFLNEDGEEEEYEGDILELDDDDEETKGDLSINFRNELIDMRKELFIYGQKSRLNKTFVYNEEYDFPIVIQKSIFRNAKGIFSTYTDTVITYFLNVLPLRKGKEYPVKRLKSIFSIFQEEFKKICRSSEKEDTELTLFILLLQVIKKVADEYLFCCKGDREKIIKKLRNQFIYFVDKKFRFFTLKNINYKILIHSTILLSRGFSFLLNDFINNRFIHSRSGPRRNPRKGKEDFFHSFFKREYWWF